MTEADEPRCRAGRRCAEGDNVYDPDTRERVDRLGKILYKPGLCDACTRSVSYALANLPGDVGELSELLEPATRIRYRDPDMPSQPHVMTAPPLPLRSDVFDLQHLIDYEATMWAESVADHANLAWDSKATERSTQLHRVTKACRLLKTNLAAFVALPPQEHRARSLAVRRDHGHDPDHATRNRDDYWTIRDGIQGALRLVELHERATRYAGRHPDTTITPCPTCHRRTLYREHRLNKVLCRYCKDEFSDDDFSAFMTEVYKAYGIDEG